MSEIVSTLVFEIDTEEAQKQLDELERKTGEVIQSIEEASGALARFFQDGAHFSTVLPAVSAGKEASPTSQAAPHPVTETLSRSPRVSQELPGIFTTPPYKEQNPLEPPNNWMNLQNKLHKIVEDPVDSLLSRNKSYTNGIGESSPEHFEKIQRTNWPEDITKLSTGPHAPQEKSPIDLPRIDVPQIDLPRIDVPQIDLPKIDIPQIDLPRIDVPQIDLPRIDIPQATLSKLETQPIVLSQAENRPTEESQPERDLRTQSRQMGEFESVLTSVKSLFNSNTVAKTTTELQYRANNSEPLPEKSFIKPEYPGHSDLLRSEKSSSFNCERPDAKTSDSFPILLDKLRTLIESDKRAHLGEGRFDTNSSSPKNELPHEPSQLFESSLHEICTLLEKQTTEMSQLMKSANNYLQIMANSRGESFTLEVKH